jgi:hypothetical protein
MDGGEMNGGCFWVENGGVLRIEVWNESYE